MVTRARPHRPKRTAAQKRHDAALHAWVEHHMGDPVPARYAVSVIHLHASFIAWMREAEQGFLTPAPQRRHPFDDREAGRGARVSGTRDPDDWMVGLVDRWMLSGGDPEHLDPIRHAMTHKLGELAGWYIDKAGVPLLHRWEPLAVRLGDLIGDQVAANALATSMLGHHALALTALTPSRGVCHAARQHWPRLDAWYVRILDEQPNPRRRAQVESVGLDGERRIG